MPTITTDATGNTYVNGVQLGTCECAQCGMTFAMPLGWQQERRRNHSSFFCPAGHSQHYPGKSDIEKLGDELAAVKRSKEYVEARLKSEHDRLDAERKRSERIERQRRAERGHRTRLQRRVANGVCPCCDRHFTNLHQHLTTEHPEYVAAAKAEGDDGEAAVT